MQIAFQTRLLITISITLLVAALLLWDHFHGGVPSHHILQQKDLPAISNWWNVLLLPTLTWVVLARINRRWKQQATSMGNGKSRVNRSLVLSFTGLCFAIVMAVSFTFKLDSVMDLLLLALLIVSLLLPIYYAEFILGFVLGMTYTFGALLPTVFVLLLATIGFVIYRFVRPLLMRLAGMRRANP